MARPLRIEYPGAWYHVTCRGNERRAIFRDDRGRELGGVGVSALSQNRARLTTKMRRDPRLQEHFGRLRAALNQNPRLE
jgi:REP element-mobilizing transposase RayT